MMSPAIAPSMLESSQGLCQSQLEGPEPPCMRRALSKSKSSIRYERSSGVMRVYLVQHGESKSEEEDPQRRLTDKGIGEVQNVADFLRPLGLAVNAIWHSDKARAQQTGELLADAVWARDRLVQRQGLGPKDQVAATKEALEQTGGDLMIVGHLPFLGKLVALLV